jgi:hemoglobin
MRPEQIDLTPAAPDPAAIEAAIDRMVRRFYDGWHDDELLAPILAGIDDLEHHLRIIADFWSRQLLGTDRYAGRPFPPHARLRIEPEHFEHWMALFAPAVRAELPDDLAEAVLTKARNMATAFQAGLFPLRGLDGRPKRLPPAG